MVPGDEIRIRLVPWLKGTIGEQMELGEETEGRRRHLPQVQRQGSRQLLSQRQEPQIVSLI